MTPIDRRGQIVYSEFINNFELKDLCGIYDSTVMIPDSLYKPVIELLYASEEKLHSYFLRMNEEIDFNYSKELEEILNEWFSASKVFDSRGSIIGYQKIKENGKKLSEIVVDELKNPSSDYIKEYAEGRLSSNVMTPIVMLYFFLEKTARLHQ